MSKSPSKTGLLVLATMLVIILSLAAFGCSANGTPAGSTSSAGASTSTTVSASDGSTGTGSPSATSPVVVDKSPEEWAAEIPELQKAVDADPTDLDALQALAVAQNKADKYADAEATYLKMLEIQDDPATHNNYANVLRNAGKIAQAKAEYEKALAADPTLTAAYLNLAVVYATEKNVTEAVKVLDRGLAAITGDDQKRLQIYKDKLTATTTT